jgi:hypothetical protein
MSIDRSSGSEALDKAAIETIATWRFNPMVCNGKATDSFAIVPVDFSLVPDSLAASDGAASSSGWEVAPDPSPMEFPDVRQAEKYLSSRPDVHELPTKPGEFSTVRMFQNRDFSRIWYLHKLPLLHFVEVTRWREEMRQGKRVGLYAHLCDGSADACASNLADEVEWMRKNPPPPPPHPPASE